MKWRLVVEDDSYGGALAHLALFGTSSEPIAALYDHDTYWSAWLGEDYGGEFSTLELAKQAVEAALGGGNAS